MKYLVTFVEKSLIKRMVECEVEAESEEDAELQIKNGNYNFIDNIQILSEDVEIASIEESDED